MDEGRRVSLLRGSRGLLYWNFFSLFFILFPFIIPTTDFLASNLRYIMFNSVVCAAFTWWRLGVPIKIIWPIRFTLLLQIWLTICSYLGTIDLGRTNDFETSNYFLVMAVIYFLNTAIVSYVWHEYRRWFLNVLLVIFTVSCILGFLQFLKVPPALAVARFYNSNDITAWGTDANGIIVHGAGSVRAVGLAAWPEWLAIHALLAWGIVASRLLQRSLTNREFVAASFFLLTSFIAQSRVMYLSVLLCSFAFLYLLIHRDRHKGGFYVSIFLGTLAALLIVGGERMSYVLTTNVEKDRTLEYRQDIGWQQAYRIMEERPWVGIGPDDGLVWNVRRAIPDKYVQGENVDNGFLVLLSWGGLPALALFMPILFISIGTGFMLTRDRTLSFERRQIGFVCGLLGFLLFNNMFLNNGFTNIWLNCIFASLGAMGLPNSFEAMQELRQRYHIRRGKQSFDTIEYANSTE